MKIIQVDKYLADDGSQWGTAEDALRRDAINQLRELTEEIYFPGIGPIAMAEGLLDNISRLVEIAKHI